MIQRANMTMRREEAWRPPLFKKSSSSVHRAAAAARRFFDLQAGTAWADLAEELKTTQGSLLDVGCGAQPFRSLVPSGVTYIGTDTVNAKDHFGYEMPDTIYYAGDIWPMRDGGADNVLCTETLEHVLEPKAFLAEMARCLRPGGRAILTVPFAARWHFIPYDYWRYTPSSLKYLLEEAGFANVRVYARGNAGTVACYKTMALFLPFLFRSEGGPVSILLSRLFGLLTFPIVLVLAALGNLSCKLPGGDDCLGYTVTAQKSAEERIPNA